ncbi:hypothetical protein H1W00_15595 [Aeromicrobium sp. Marseille-Q0843]|uniref:Uncharacterized protein n=1 Tax=Aeromicrobium phoceense TaxID=2754045 RepID=A0A838XS54_9ACTN|nr:hypothetical protein [Aeromicrobium phoceense]MBA4609904.1 hypothetical protein [Aeromicrobium phoceense]
MTSRIEQLRRRRHHERGDVPGWVMITLMTAGIVVGLTAMAGPRLSAMLNQALSSVGG